VWKNYQENTTLAMSTKTYLTKYGEVPLLEGNNYSIPTRNHV
jgi:hypothetical protein